MAKATQKQEPVAARAKAIAINRVHFVIFAAVAVFAYSCLRFDLTQDDAYISFRYAANFLAGDGLVYNAGERVEGYTNFLWVMLLALCKGLLGIDYLVSSRFFGVVAGAAIFYLVYLLLKSHYEKPSVVIYLGLAIMLLSNQSLPYWSIASLETSAFACMALAAVVAEYRRPQLTAALAVIATLLRPEGAVVFGVILLNRIVTQRRIPLRYVLTYLIPLIPFAAFKIGFYGSLFPNPYYAKSGVGLEYIESGLEYFWFFTRTLGVYGVIFLFPLLMIKRLWSRYSLLYLFVAIYTAYIIWVGGDVLKVYRFFVPVVPALYFLFVVSLAELASIALQNRRRAYGAALAVVAAYSTGSFLLAREHVNTYWYYEQNIVGKMHFVSTMLRKHMGSSFSIAASTIGMVGYQLLGHRVIDMLGLTDSYIARNPEKVEGIVSTWKERRFNSRYLLEQQPDFILFSTGYKPSAPAERALMLHSEFRRNYRTVGFLRVNEYKVVWRRIGEVDISKDVVHADLDFVTKLNDGFYHLSRGTPQTALADFREAQRRLGEEYPILVHSLGASFLRLRQLDSAQYYFLRATELDPNCWEARLQLADIARQFGDTATANSQLGYLNAKMPWLFDKSYRPLREGVGGD